MIKRFIVMIFAVLFCMASATVCFAESELPRLVDDADLLSSSEEAELLTILNGISEKHQFDVVIYTVDSLDGEMPRDVADDFYDYNGYGYGVNYDGALLLVAIDEGEWYISTCGYGIEALTDAGIEYIGELMVSNLSDGNFYDAFVTYAQCCDEFVTSAENGEPYDVYNLPKESFAFGKSLLISLVIGLVIALVVTLIMASQLKSVCFNSTAADYEKPGSMQITNAHEFFLYRNINRVKKAENSSGGSSVHTSSSGRTHGGGGGSF